MVHSTEEEDGEGYKYDNGNDDDCWDLASLVIHVIAKWMDARSQPI